MDRRVSEVQRCIWMQNKTNHSLTNIHINIDYIGKVLTETILKTTNSINISQYYTQKVVDSLMC